MIRVGLLGYGLAGRVFHAPFITATPDFHLTAIATHSWAERAAHDYPTARICSASEALAAADIDLIVVATPNQTHASLALQALNAGKSVIVDKPMATSVAEAQRMVERASQCNLKLTVFQNRRWDDDFVTISQLLRTSRLGEWTGYESRFDRFRPVVADRWRERPLPGGGLWWDLGPHLLDQTLQLLGQPDAVQADLAMQRLGAQVPDFAHVVLHYGQRRAILNATCLDPNPGFRFRIQGTLGAFTTRGLDPQEAHLSGDRSQPPQPRYGELTTIRAGVAVTEREPLACGDYGGFYRAMRDCLMSGGELPVTPQSALATMTLMELAIQSDRRLCIVEI